MKTLRFVKQAAAPALAAALVLGAATGPSAAYFTTYVTAQGGEMLHLSQRQVIPHEQVQANVKSISVENTGELECYVRVRVTAGSQVTAAFSGAGWSNGGDGYWYYASPVAPGASTDVLSATLILPMGTPDDPIPEGTTLNVVVVSECAPVLYDETGAARPNGPAYMGWTLAVKEG